MIGLQFYRLLTSEEWRERVGNFSDDSELCSNVFHSLRDCREYYQR